MPLLEVRGLEKWYGRRQVVNGVDFDVRDAVHHPGHLGQDLPRRAARCTEGGRELHQRGPLTQLAAEVRLGQGTVARLGPTLSAAVPKLSRFDRAVRSCAVAKGFDITMLLGTPSEGHSRS